MYHISNNKVIDADTVGSWQDKTATEVLLSPQDIFD